MKPIATGIIAAMVTSMHEDESLNFQEIEHQVNRQIDAGVDGVFCLGTNGEAYILSEDEKLRVIETVVKAADGRVPVYAGTGLVAEQLKKLPFLFLCNGRLLLGPEQLLLLLLFFVGFAAAPSVIFSLLLFLFHTSPVKQKRIHLPPRVFPSVPWPVNESPFSYLSSLPRSYSVQGRAP